MKRLVRYLLPFLLISVIPTFCQVKADGQSSLPKVITVLKDVLLPSPPPEQKPKQENPEPTDNESAETATPAEEKPTSDDTSPTPKRPVFEALHELEIQDDGFNWRRDWWKYAIMILCLVVSLSLLAYFLKALVRLLHAVICIAFGALGSALALCFLRPWVLTWLPEELHWASKSICAGLGFLLFYGLTGVTIRFLRRPLKTEVKAE
jgi:hypothetical protein